MRHALKLFLIAAHTAGIIYAVSVANQAQAQTSPFKPQMVTWFCKSAERVDALMHAPGRAFLHGMMFSIAKGNCGIGLYGATFVFMPEAIAAKGTSAEGGKYVVLKGKLFPRLGGGVEAFAPFDADSFDKKNEGKAPKPAKGQPV